MLLGCIFEINQENEADVEVELVDCGDVYGSDFCFFTELI